VASSPAIGSDGTVYVGSWDKKLYAIKPDSKGLAKSPWPMRGQNLQHTGRVMK
jgi:outer membrane protein assembly factor BamB